MMFQLFRGQKLLLKGKLANEVKPRQLRKNEERNFLKIDNKFLIENFAIGEVFYF